MKREGYRIVSSSPKKTRLFGKMLGRLLTRGSLVAISGDLGSGKTCLTQGIAKGLEVPENHYITSPTYTLVNEYPGRITLYHIDLYRIGDISELDDIGLDDILTSDGIAVVEWAERIISILPEERLDLEISVIDDHTREFHLIGYGQKAVDLAEKCSKYH